MHAEGARYDQWSLQNNWVYDDFRELSLCLLSNSDTPTLVELTRLLGTVLSNEQSRHIWLKAWSAELDYREKIMFILSSSVNSESTYHTSI